MSDSGGADGGGFDGGDFGHDGYDCSDCGGDYFSSADTPKYRWCSRCESNYRIQLEYCPRCSDLSDDQVHSLIVKEKNSLDKMATRMLYGIGGVVLLLCIVFFCL